MHAHWSDTEIAPTAEGIKAIAHPLRLGIICLLAEGELSVGEIRQALGTSQPNISHHLTRLSDRRLLTSRKDANRVYYAIADQRLNEIVGMLQGVYCG